MSKVRIVLRKEPSQSVTDLGAAIEREYGIKPLVDGEIRPAGNYAPNHYTAGLGPVRSGTENAT